MLDNQVDSVLVGSNYLSCLFSFALMKNKKQVLLLDDGRFRYGELYTNSLCQLEKDYLRIWVQKTGIFPSLDIDHYVTKKNLMLAIDNKRIRLGGSPWQNYREILRKLPFCFKKEDSPYLAPITGKKNQQAFDRDYFAYCHDLAQSIWYLDTNNLIDENFLANCPERLLNIVQILSSSLLQKKNMKEGERELLNTFIYMTRGYFHKKLAVDASFMELFHLILSLLSPRYELNEDSFLSTIKKNYREEGGQYRKTNIKQWYFDRCRPWRLELTSYEGVVCPKYISFFGGLPSGMPIDIGPFVDNYTCVDVCWKLKKNSSTQWENEKIFCSSTDNIGTNYPLWAVDFLPGMINAKVFIKNHFGNKISFVQKKIHHLLISRLQSFVVGIEEIIESEQMSFNPEILTRAEVSPSSRTSGTCRQMVISDISNPIKRVDLKNVDYFGPFKGGNFGLLSTLMELKKDNFPPREMKRSNNLH